MDFIDVVSQGFTYGNCYAIFVGMFAVVDEFVAVADIFCLRTFPFGFLNTGDIDVSIAEGLC